MQWVSILLRHIKDKIEKEMQSRKDTIDPADCIAQDLLRAFNQLH